MNCCGCGSNDVTARLFEFKTITVRQYNCRACGVEFETIEQFKDYENNPSESKVIPVNNPKNPSNNPVKGGLGVSSSDLGLSHPGLIADPDLTSVKHEQGNGKSGRGPAKEYPEEFEKAWAGCKNPRGLKFKAYRAWVKLKPSAEIVVRVFLMWRETDDWRRGFEPHLSTWLNGRGWETEPAPAEMRPRGAPDTRAQRTMSTLENWTPPTRKVGS